MSIFARMLHKTTTTTAAPTATTRPDLDNSDQSNNPSKSKKKKIYKEEETTTTATNHHHDATTTTPNNNDSNNNNDDDGPWTMVERVQQTCPLLKEPSRQVTAHFYRDEIQLGDLVRAGVFTHVYQVKRLPRYYCGSGDCRCHHVVDHNNPTTNDTVGHGGVDVDVPSSILRGVGQHHQQQGQDSATIKTWDDTCTSGTHLSHSPEEEERRRVCCASCTTPGAYSLKQLSTAAANHKNHPKRRRGKQRQPFFSARMNHVAAATLVLEAQFLARLQHPHIIKLRGVPLGEEAVLINGQQDGFFLMTDMIVETLAERIDRWREQEDEERRCNEDWMRRRNVGQAQGNNDDNHHHHYKMKNSLQVDTTSKIFRSKLAMAKNIISALDYLQSSERRIVVMNLNPGNIGFLQDGTVQLFDLGHCRQVVQQQQQRDNTSHHHRHGANNRNNSNNNANANDNTDGGEEEEKVAEADDDYNNGLSDDELSVDDLSVMLGSPIHVPPPTTTTANTTTRAAAATASGTAPSTPARKRAVASAGAFRTVIPTAAMGVVPRYLAPEIVTRGQYSLQSDAYSFALILFEMLTLSPPYAAYQPGQHFIRVCIQGKRPNITLYQFPPALDSLIQKGWKHNWNKRLSVATMKQVLLNHNNVPFTTTKKKKKSRKHHHHQGDNAAVPDADSTDADNKNNNQSNDDDADNNTIRSHNCQIITPQHRSHTPRRRRPGGGGGDDDDANHGQPRQRRAGRRPHRPNEQPEQQQHNATSASPRNLPSWSSASNRDLSSTTAPAAAAAAATGNAAQHGGDGGGGHVHPNHNPQKRILSKSRERGLLAMVSPMSRKKQTAEMTTVMRRNQHRLSIQQLPLE